MVVIIKECRKCGNMFETGGFGGQTTCDQCSDQVAYIGIRQPDGSIRTEIHRYGRARGWGKPQDPINDLNDADKIIDRLGKTE